MVINNCTRCPQVLVSIRQQGKHLQPSCSFVFQCLWAWHILSWQRPFYYCAQSHTHTHSQWSIFYLLTRHSTITALLFYSMTQKWLTMPVAAHHTYAEKHTQTQFPSFESLGIKLLCCSKCRESKFVLVEHLCVTCWISWVNLADNAQFSESWGERSWATC